MTDGNKEFVGGDIKLILNNPSNISARTTGLRLPLRYQGHFSGFGVLADVLLVPGKNAIKRRFHYQPTNPNDTVAKGFLQKYIQSMGHRGQEMILQELVTESYGRALNGAPFFAI